MSLINKQLIIKKWEPYDVVDFGLSVKWLKYNLAGDKLTDNESDYGYYYQWGDTIGYPDAAKHNFRYLTTPYIKNPVEPTFTKYVAEPLFGDVDNKDVLDPEDDAVTTLLGSEYRMPTKDEYIELYKHCSGVTELKSSDYDNILIDNNKDSILKNGVYWINSNSVIDGVKYINSGALFVGQDITKRIFFPAAGYCYDSKVANKCSFGRYLTKSLNINCSCYVYRLSFGSKNIFGKLTLDYNSRDSRYYGCSIRGIKIS